VKVLPENRSRLDRLPEEIRNRVARRLAGAAGRDHETRQAPSAKARGCAPFVDRNGNLDAQSIALIHPVGGHAFCYQPIVRALPPDVAAYCVHHPDAMASRPALASTIESLARRYREAIADFGGPKPRVVAGWSFGGVVAHEMARQWEQAGSGVDAVVLIDSPLPEGRAWLRIKSLTRPARQARDLAHDAAALANSRDYQHFAETLGVLPRFSDISDADVLGNLLSVCAANHAALVHHRFGSIESPLHYLLASRSPESDGVQETRARLARIASGPVQLNACDEDHFSIVADRSLETITRLLIHAARGEFRY
jgi:thioesterase domain-containing protein